MANNYWLEQEKKFLKAIKGVAIPDGRLKKIDFIAVKNSDTLSSIPNGGGCYWIWTNEPVRHSLHKNKFPGGFKGGEIIYNGIAKDDVRGRVFHHLFGFVDAGWSGISMDIYMRGSISHRKKACSKNGKVPFLDNKPIRDKKHLLRIFYRQARGNIF